MNNNFSTLPYALTLALGLMCSAGLQAASPQQLPAAVAATETLAATQIRPGAAAQGRRAQFALRTAADPALAAIVDLLALERLYRQQQKPDQALQLYTDVLGRTDNLTVRNFAERRLARLQWRSGAHDAAEATLQRNLSDNLGRASTR